jgi:RHS repeat-associated protein
VAHEPFTGKELDSETSLQYFGARYYMAALGRWGQVDPLADQYAGHSPYNYVLGNPNSLIDPDGMQVAEITAGSMEEFGANYNALNGGTCDPPGSCVRQAADLGASFVPGVSTAVDVTTAVSGTNPVTGEDVGLLGRGLAVVGVLSPVGGGQIRAAGQFLEAGTRELAERFGRRYLIRVRQSVGRLDEASSAAIREVDSADRTVSITHRVVRPDGQIVHQHQEHLGRYGTTRTFPDEWVQFPTIPPRPGSR